MKESETQLQSCFTYGSRVSRNHCIRKSMYMYNVQNARVTCLTCGSRPCTCCPRRAGVWPGGWASTRWTRSLKHVRHVRHVLWNIKLSAVSRVITEQLLSTLTAWHEMKDCLLEQDKLRLNNSLHFTATNNKIKKKIQVVIFTPKSNAFLNLSFILSIWKYSSF